MSSTRNKIQFLTFATLLPNSQTLRSFGILLDVRKQHYAWMLLHTQMFSGCAFVVNLVVSHYLNFRITARFSQDVRCQWQMHEDARVRTIQALTPSNTLM